VEEIQQMEVTIDTADKLILTEEFAAMSLSLPNNIDFTSFCLSSPDILLDNRNMNPVVLATLSEHFNTALNSACTNYIIRYKSLFQTYDVNGAVPVKTANCGFLTTLAIGEVKFYLMINGKKIVWTLKNCLHAPDVPINLISVGALQEHHISVIFTLQKTTIMFPSSHPQLSGLSFNAEVIRQLSLLNLDFIPATAITPAIALTSFPIVHNFFELWHRHFGHLSQEATGDMLNKNYATGITYTMTTPTPLQCIPCLIGKAPQAPYAHNAKRASKVCDLIHIDTCGSFSTLTPQKEAYFIAFLDDTSNYGAIALLITKNCAYIAWRKVEASWTLKSSNPIRAARLDGAKEFIQGPMSKHMISKGIDVQVTAPYTHAQNEKIERYIHTIEDGIQMLLTDSKLPPFF
jgi:hypothetical protein